MPVRTSLYTDSLDKIVLTYLACVTRAPFVYKGKAVRPRPLYVSPLIFRGYTCPPGCGACCPRFSLVYLPTDPMPADPHLRTRIVEINGRGRILFEDAQDDHKDHFCRHIDHGTGRCGIHGSQPFSCDFELLRCKLGEHRNMLGQQLFGRGWKMKRVDGKKGTLCDMIPMDAAFHKDLVRRLTRLHQWAMYLGFDTYLPQVISWAQSGPHAEPLILKPGGL